MKYFTIAILFLFILLASCEKEPSGPVAIQLTGTWVLDEYDEALTLMKSASELKDDDYGFIFHSNGKFTERKNAGFCGTPPIHYENFDGTWELQGDTMILIEVAYWGGEMSCTFKIDELSNNRFSFYQDCSF